MAVALRLGGYFSWTDTQQGQSLTKAEEQAQYAAMTGEIRAGGYYSCVYGYMYIVGECGPRCGHAIGGQQHRLEGGNAHVAFDEEEEAAWPQ